MFLLNVGVFLRTVASAFFKPTTRGDVGGHVSWSRHCFNRSLSDVNELRADFMVACTDAVTGKGGLLLVFISQQRRSSHKRSFYYHYMTQTLVSGHFKCSGAWKSTLLMLTAPIS